MTPGVPAISLIFLIVPFFGAVILSFTAPTSAKVVATRVHGFVVSVSSALWHEALLAFDGCVSLFKSAPNLMAADAVETPIAPTAATVARLTAAAVRRVVLI